MFANTVFKASVDTKKWIKGAAIRAVKTMAQTAGALIVTAQMIQQVNWQVVLGTTALAGLASILTSIAGLPEVQENTEVIEYKKED